ncbi:MAG: DUF493 domain-containing protein [Bacteroidota bacterium]
MELPEPGSRPLTRIELLEVLRANHVFPGEYQLTVFAKSGNEFYALLHATLKELQGESSYTIQERPSSKKNFTSYRIQIYVESAETALYRKEIIGQIAGVLMML